MKMRETGKFAVIMTEGYDLPDVIVVDTRAKARELVEALRAEDPQADPETIYFVRVREIADGE